MKKITLAGGCFWGVDAYFNQLKGVIDTNSGYANGNIDNPTYEQVCNGDATHAEAVQITYDENIISLENILNHFLRFVDPYSLNKQGNDIGPQYRSGVYYEEDIDIKTITSFFNNLQEKSNKKVLVEIKKLENYYLAEEYHQDYLIKNPNGYCHVNLNLIKENEKK